MFRLEFQKRFEKDTRHVLPDVLGAKLQQEKLLLFDGFGCGIAEKQRVAQFLAVL